MPESQWNVKRFVGEHIESKTKKRLLEVEWEETDESAYLVRKYCPSVYEAYKNKKKNDFKILGIVEDANKKEDEDVRFAVEYVDDGKREAMKLSDLKKNHADKLIDYLEERARYLPAQ